MSRQANYVFKTYLQCFRNLVLTAEVFMVDIPIILGNMG